MLGMPLLCAQCTAAHLPLHSHGPACVTAHCSFLAHSRCSIRNSKVKTAGKFGHVHFFCNSLQVCMERRGSSERT